MSNGLQLLESMVGAALAREPLPTPQRIRELIENLRATPLCADVTSDEAERLAKALETRHGVTMKIGSVLTGERWEPWLDAARAQITPYYLERYRKLLTQKGLSGQGMATIDTVTHRLLGLLENP